MTSRRLAVALAVFGVLSSGCTEDEALAPAHCVPDATAIAAAACLFSTDCPCGSHCEYGQCTAACLSGEDCDDGGRCDVAGFCRAPGETGVVPRLDQTPPTLLSVQPPALRLSTVDATRAVYVSTRERDADRLRVVATEGLLVQCSEEASPGPECDLTGVVAEEPRRVLVRTDPTATSAPRVAELRVHSRWHSAGAMVERPPANTGPRQGALTVSDVPVGRYVGTATARLRTSEDGDADADLQLEVPVELEKHAQKGGHVHVVLRDPLHALSSSGALVGSLTSDGETVEFQLGLHPLLDSEDGRGPRIDANIADATLQYDEKGQSLGLTLEMTLEGLGPGIAPVIEWELALDFSHGFDDEHPEPADLPDTPAALTADVSGRLEGAHPLEVALGWPAFAPSDAQDSAAIVGEWSDLRTCDDEQGASDVHASVCQALVAAGHFVCPQPSAAVSETLCTMAGSQGVPCALVFDESLELSACDVDGGHATPALVAEEVEVCDDKGTVTEYWHVGWPRAEVAWKCAERFLCLDETVATFDGSLEMGVSLAVSGDLMCSGGGWPRVFPLFTNADAVDAAGPDETALLPSTGVLLDACLQDLEVLSATPTSPSEAGVPGLLELFGSHGCVDVLRLVRALVAAQRADRTRAMNEEDPVVHHRASQLAMRLLYQWLQVNTFATREGWHAYDMREMLDLDESEGEPPYDPPDPRELLARSLRAWWLVLHPRFAAPTWHAPPEAIADPDYRELPEGEEPGAHHEHENGLPVAMEQLLRAQLELARDVVRREAMMRTASGLAQPVAGRAVRSALVTVLMANRQREAAADAEWLSRWQDGRLELSAALAMLIGAQRRLHEGANPLGIEDDDLPVYFYGSVADLPESMRFTAISAFLLGMGPTQDFGGWAQIATEEAMGALEAARNTWKEGLESKLQRRLEQHEWQTRMDEIKDEYAGQVFEFCGAPNYSLDTPVEQVLEWWKNVDPNNCFVVGSGAEPGESNPACFAGNADLAGPILDKVPNDSLSARLCTARTHDVSLGPVLDAHLADPTTNDIVEGKQALNPSDPASPIVLKFQGGTELQIERDALVRLAFSAAAEDCLAHFAQASPTLTIRELDPALAAARDDPACYRGTMGELAVTIVAANKDIEIANAELAGASRALELAIEACIQQKEASAGRALVESARLAFVTAARTLRLFAEDIRILGSGVKEAGQIAQGVDPQNAWWTGVGGVAAWGGLVVEKAGELAVAQYDSAISTADDVLQWELAVIEADLADRQCEIEIEAQRPAMVTAARAVERAYLDLVAAQVELQNQKELLKFALGCGPIAIRNHQDRKVLSLADTFFLAEQIRLYKRRMEIARRVAYLAGRALDYEFQWSGTGQVETLSAATPFELETLVDELAKMNALGGIDGKHPTSDYFILSLRRDILGEDDDAAWQTELNDPNRKRDIDPHPDRERMAMVYEFNLSPSQVVAADAEADSVIEVIAANNCAERVWGVNAIVRGTLDDSGERRVPYHGADSTRVQLELHQRNTFASQWCSGHGEAAEELQVVSVRPSKNLFLPGGGEGAMGAGGVATDETQAFARARISAHLNVGIAEFQEEEYVQGDSPELAARGLYGTYRLVLPLEDVLTSGGDRGLDLSQVEDIVLRFDFVSVAR